VHPGVFCIVNHGIAIAPLPLLFFDDCSHCACVVNVELVWPC
jgi:hypothetical protein